MEPNDAGAAALNQTLGATGLRTRLASEDFGAAVETGHLLTVLGEQVRVVSASPYGSPIAFPPTQPGVRLDTGGAVLLQGGRS